MVEKFCFEKWDYYSQTDGADPTITAIKSKLGKTTREWRKAQKRFFGCDRGIRDWAKNSLCGYILRLK